MNYAITQLEIALEVAENNAPIQEADGNLEQAALNRQVAKDCKEAIKALKFERESFINL